MMRFKAKLFLRESGVSAVVGVILMVAITVVASSAVFLYVGGYIQGTPGPQPLILSAKSYTNPNQTIFWTVYTVQGGSVKPPCSFRLVNSSSGALVAWWSVLGFGGNYGFSSPAQSTAQYGRGPLYMYLVFNEISNTGILRQGDSFVLVLSTSDLSSTTPPVMPSASLHPFSSIYNPQSAVMDQSIIGSWDLQVFQGNSMVYRYSLFPASGIASFSMSPSALSGGEVGSGSSSSGSGSAMLFSQLINVYLRPGLTGASVPHSVQPLFSSGSGTVSASLIYNVTVSIGSYVFQRDITIKNTWGNGFNVFPQLANGTYTLTISMVPKGQDILSVGGATFFGYSNLNWASINFTPDICSSAPYTSSAQITVSGYGEFYVTVQGNGGAVLDILSSVNGIGTYAVKVVLQSDLDKSQYVQLAMVSPGSPAWLNFTVPYGGYNLTIYVSRVSGGFDFTVSLSGYYLTSIAPGQYYTSIYVSGIRGLQLSIKELG
jgi:hypothetical protein